MLKYSTSNVYLKKEEFKYYNLTLTNTDVFCDKTSYLTNRADGSYQVRDNINVVESKPSAHLSNNYTT